MALVLKDRVKESSVSTGTGAITLDGATGAFQPFSVIGNGNTTYYAIAGQTTNEWEVGIGTYDSGTDSISRDTILASSNSDTIVTFSAGTKDVFITYPSEKGVWVDASGTSNYAATIGSTAVNLGATVSTLAGLTSVTVTQDPSVALDLATKQYVDGLVSSGITYHAAVKYEVPDSTGNLTATYNNGTSGVGATLTNAGTQTAFTPDGIVATAGDRVLIYNQTSAFQNGVYEVTTVGSGSTNWVLTRTTDADSYGLKDPNALGNGDAFFVTSGNTGAGETYVCNTVGVITFGTTAITFQQISASQVYNAGTGLTLSPATTFNIANTAVTAASYGAASKTLTATVNAQGQLTALADTNIAIAMSQVTSGTLGATQGGTDQSSYSIGDILYADTTTSLARLADVATGNALISGGLNAAPSWGKIALASAVSGTLPIANGGTNSTATPTAGGVAYGTGTAYAVNTAGTLGQYLVSGGAGAPTWTTLPTNVASISFGTTGLTPSTATTGAVTVAGTLALANGGTGNTTAQGAMNTLAGATTLGQYLRGNGTNVVMAAIVAGDVPTLNQNTTGSAATLTTGRTIAITGDLAYTSGSFNGSANVTGTGTLATVNANVGSFTNASLTVNAKGLITAASSGTAPVTSVTGTSPVVSSGGATPAISLASAYGDTLNPYASKTANYVLAAPDGTAGVPTFRNLTLLDMPGAWVKKAVECATTAALTVNTAQVTIDGVTLTATSRVLVKDQAAPAQNGIYTGVSTTTWVRAVDADTSAEIAGAMVSIDGGTVNGGLVYDNDFKTTDTLGTTAMTWNRVLDRGYLTTVGNSYATLTNPSAITFPRMNADNTVSALDAATFRTAIGAGTSSTTGTVTSVAALTIGTTGTDLSSTVATGTTTPVITLQVPTASATNRGALSSADWTTFNNKQAALGFTPYNATNPNNYIALASAITGYTVGTNTALAATDTLLAGLGKIQGQINARGTGNGTVTSVGGTGTVSGLSLSGTVTTTGNLTLGGTLAVTASNFASQTANTFLAAPNGAAGVPTFRAVVAADIPTLNQNTTGSSGSCTGNAATATNADTTDGYHASLVESVNTLATRNASGYLFANYFNGSGTFATTGDTSGMARFTGTNGADTYGRSYTAAAAAAALSGQTMNIAGSSTSCSGNAATATTATNLSGGTVAATTITATGNITAYFSDERLKTRLGTIENALAKVQTLDGFYYEPNETAQALGYGVKREVGVSAQQVQAILPEIIAPAPIDNKYLTVDYERLVPLLIEAIKELKAEVDELKKAK